MDQQGEKAIFFPSFPFLLLPSPSLPFPSLFFSAPFLLFFSAPDFKENGMPEEDQIIHLELANLSDCYASLVGIDGTEVTTQISGRMLGLNLTLNFFMRSS